MPVMRPLRRRRHNGFRYGSALPILMLLLHAPAAPARGDFRVLDTQPADGATGVPLDASIQAHVSAGPDAQSLRDKENIKLVGPKGAVPVVVTTDLGGVVRISPADRLQPKTRYTLEIGAGLRSKVGDGLSAPVRSTFTTGERVAGKVGGPRLAKRKLFDARGLTTLAVGPDQHLYVADWTGTVVRHRLDPATGLSVGSDVVWQNAAARIISLTVDPKGSADRVVLWVTADDHPAESVTKLDFTGFVSRLDIPVGGKAAETRYITGLPNGAHPVNGAAFGPDGRLYVSQGAATHLGGSDVEHAQDPWRETPMSAAVLVADVNAPGFAGGRLPVDVRTDAPISYDPTRSDVPVKLYATGVREAYDLCWHSNGHLYAGVNMNDTGNSTPKRGDLPAVNVRPDEMLINIKPGFYYGHPNPTRSEWVLLGGNPTAGKDPWEVTKLPVGTRPEPKFDPSLLMMNLVPVSGQSADGCAEYTADGELKGMLLSCFYTASRTVHAFRFDATGDKVADHYDLTGADGKPIRFGAPLDIAVHPSGRIYVADFEDPRRGDAGKSGGVWVMEAAK